MLAERPYSQSIGGQFSSQVDRKTLFIGRVLHGIGLSVSSGATLPRAIGALATWVAYLTAATVLLFYAIG